MIRLFIQRLLALHDIKKERAFMINHGFTHDEVRGLLRRSPKMMSFEMMTHLCNAFRCMPNDLLTWDGDPSSHLQSLKRPTVKAFEKLIEGKSPQEIEDVMSWLEEKLREGGK